MTQLEKWQFDIRMAMAEKGITGSDLAQVIGKSQPSVTECIKRGTGSDMLKLAISKVLGVHTPWRLFEDIDLGLENK